MALGTNHVTNTTAATFIPELWSDEIVAAYKSNLVLANLVNRMPMSGKKGDTLHIFCNNNLWLNLFSHS